MTAVTLITAIVSASARLIGNRPSRTGANALAIVVPPNAADRKPASVTPICTADRNRLGSPVNWAISRPRLPRRASCLTWLSRSDTNAISAAANTPPIRINRKIMTTLNTVSLVWDHHPLLSAGECRRWFRTGFIFSGMSHGRTSSSMPRRGRQRPARQRSGPTGADADEVRPTGRRQLPEGPAAPPRGDPYNCAITDSARFGADFDRLSMIITNDALEVWRWR